MAPSGHLLSAASLPMNGLRGAFDHSEHRREERFLAERAVRAVYTNGSHESWLIDCSIHGIQVVATQHVECGDLFHLQIPGNRLVTYRCTYSFEVWPNTWQLGAELAGPVSEQEAELIVQQLLTDAKEP